MPASRARQPTAEFQPPGTAVVTAPRSRPGVVKSFSALRHRNFRLYFIGLLISVTGMWAQTVAQQWLVYELTNSALVLGQVTAIMAVPVFLLSPFAGVVIDRTSRRTILFVTQVVQMLQAFALAALTFSGQIEVWHVFVLSAVRGIANAFDAPTRQSFYVELVDDREDLSNAIALNSTLMSTARILGPSLGGVIVAVLGSAWAFTINGLSFVAILGALLLMHLPNREFTPSGRSPLQDMGDGLRFIRQNRLITGLILIVLMVALFGQNFRVLLPIVASEVLGRGELTFGLMNTTSGVGSLVGALLVTYLAGLRARGRYLNLINMMLPLALFAFAASRSLVLSLVLLAFIGLTLTPQISLSNVLIQENIPDEMRGRVMAVYTMVVFGMTPVGGYLVGALAEYLGSPAAIAISAGVLFTTGAVARFFIPEIKRA